MLELALGMIYLVPRILDLNSNSGQYWSGCDRCTWLIASEPSLAEKDTLTSKEFLQAYEFNQCGK